MNQLLNVDETANLLGLSPHTLYRWVLEGRVPTVRLGRRLLFDPEALRAWVVARSRECAPPAAGTTTGHRPDGAPQGADDRNGAGAGLTGEENATP